MRNARVLATSVLTTGFLVAVTSRAEAASYFLSPAGSDTAAGTSASAAWATIARLNQATLAAGDIVCFESGGTFAGTVTLTASEKGTASAPIVFKSCATGPAVIKAPSGADAFYAHNTSGVEIQNLTFEGAGSWPNDWGAVQAIKSNGIHFLLDDDTSPGLPYIRIDHVDVSGFPRWGISFDNPYSVKTNSGFSDVRVTNTTVHDNGQGGILLAFAGWPAYRTIHKDFYIGTTLVYGNLGFAKSNTHTGDGIELASVDGATVEYSVAHDNGTNCDNNGGGPVGIWAWQANNVALQFNESHHNHVAGTHDGGGFDLDGGVTNSVMQYNYAHDNDGAGYLVGDFGGSNPTKNNVVRYNISENDGRKNGYASLYVYSGTGMDAYNNTFFNSALNGSRAVWITGGTQSAVRNTILVTTGGAPLVDVVGGVTLTQNDYFAKDAFVAKYGGTSFSSLSALQSGSGQEMPGGKMTGFSLDPGLSSYGNGGTIGDATKLSTLTAYRLTAASPLDGKGVDPSTWGSARSPRDFFGNAVPATGALDVGAAAVGPGGDAGAGDPFPDAGPIVGGSSSSGSTSSGSASSGGSSSGASSSGTGSSSGATSSGSGVSSSGAASGGDDAGLGQGNGGQLGQDAGQETSTGSSGGCSASPAGDAGTSGAGLALCVAGLSVARRRSVASRSRQKA